jgi:hypothetical protein
MTGLCRLRLSERLKIDEYKIDEPQEMYCFVAPFNGFVLLCFLLFSKKGHLQCGADRH